MNRINPREVPREGTEGFALTLHEVAKAFRSRMDEKLKPMGLSCATRRVVGALACSGRPLSQRELAEAISVEGPTLVRLLDRLQAMEWVARETVPGDRRMKHVSLTAKAEPFIDELVNAAMGIEREILKDIPEDQVATAHRVLLRLRERLGGTIGCCAAGPPNGD